MTKFFISPGDPAGIGPEITLKALSENKKHLSTGSYGIDVTAMCFDHRERKVIAGCENGTIRVINSVSGELVLPAFCL